MEYWNDLITERSWRTLQNIKGKFDFILIGGWAIYFLTRKFKSKDIDIIVDFNALAKLKKEFNLNKNNNLRKYEIKINEIDIDIYTNFYSQLTIPIEEIHYIKIEGFKVIKPEELLILKQGAEESRGYSEKGEKDRIDIISLLLFYDINFKDYLRILNKIKKQNLMSRLIILVNNFKEYQYFDLTPREFKLRKNEILRKLKSA